jgi:hypothetical protein
VETKKMASAAGRSKKTKFSANELRELAEAADALRNKDASIVENTDRSKGAARYIVMLASEAKAKGLKPIVDLLTRDDEVPSKQRETVVLSSDRPIKFPKNPKLTLADGDAIFLSLAAVDKFVVPYYVRLKRLPEVLAIREEFASNPKAAVMIHLPSSHTSIGVIAGE